MLNQNSLIYELRKSEKKLSDLKKMLDENNSTEGIIARKKGDSYNYFKSIKLGQKKYKEILLPKDSPEVIKLAKKEYLKMAIADETEKLQLLKQFEKFSNKEPHADAYLRQHPGINELLAAQFVPTEEKIKNWMGDPSSQNPRFREQLKHKTVLDFNVRSKSEQMIINKLAKHKIPLRYEHPHDNPDGSIIYIDIQVLSLKTYLSFYWEHNGMMDIPKYAETYAFKMRNLISAGIIPGVNLIQTFETKECPLDPNYVEFLIEYYLL